MGAQFSLKAGMSGSGVKAALSMPLSLTGVSRVILDKYVLMGFLLYGLGAFVWLGVLSKWDVSKAYPLVGLGFVFTTLIGYFLGEEVTPLRVAGVMLICSGVFLVGKG